MTHTGASIPRALTVVLPTHRLLPHDLAILVAPVAATESTTPDVYVGRADGVLVDDRGHLVAFVVRRVREQDAHGTRTLVPASAVAAMEGPVLRISWTGEKLRAEPQLDLPPDDRTDREQPPESVRTQDAHGLAPPGPGLNAGEAAKEGIEGAAIGAALGALAGLALGGPIAAASLAVFFAVGGSLGGAVAGAAAETTDTSVLPPPDTGGYGPRGTWFGALEERLRDPRLEAGELVTLTRLSLPATTETPREPPRAAAGQG